MARSTALGCDLLAVFRLELRVDDFT